MKNKGLTFLVLDFLIYLFCSMLPTDMHPGAGSYSMTAFSGRNMPQTGAILPWIRRHGSVSSRNGCATDSADVHTNPVSGVGSDADLCPSCLSLLCVCVSVRPCVSVLFVCLVSPVHAVCSLYCWIGNRGSGRASRHDFRCDRRAGGGDGLAGDATWR